MANTLRIKRRAAGGAAGAPASLENAELGFNEQDLTLYYGLGTGGIGGSATNIIPIAGAGAFVTLNTTQNITAEKTFTVSPNVPTVAPGDSSNKAASTAFVAAAITGGSVADGDKGDIVVSGNGTVWSIDLKAVTNTKLADMPTGTFKGRASAGTGSPEDLTVAQVRTALAINNVDNTSDANKPISSAVQTALNSKIDLTQKGAANGVVPLGADTKIAAVYLPSYVDDVEEYDNRAAFPATGEKGKLYVALDTDKTWRWSGTTYIEMKASPGTTDDVPEGTLNLYYTAARARADLLTTTIGSADVTHAPTAKAVFDALALKANLASPTFTGTPAAPTAAVATNTTQIATTAFVQANKALSLLKANNLSDLANITTARTNLGLGTMATQNANSVAITGGTIDNIVIDGGTF